MWTLIFKLPHWSRLLKRTDVNVDRVHQSNVVDGPKILLGENLVLRIQMPMDNQHELVTT